MINPWEMLERFEARHGEYHEMLGRYPSKDENENRQIKRLLRAHDRLVSMCVGYDYGRRAVTQ